MASNSPKIGLLGIVSFLGASAFAFAPALAAEQLRIGLQYGIYNVPFYVAEHEGIFERQLTEHGQRGVKVSLRSFSGPPAVTDAMLTGQVDMAVVGPAAPIHTFDKRPGTPLRVNGGGGL